MAASSSSAPPPFFFGEENQITQQHSSSAAQSSSSAPTQKKKRRLPGTPNPDAEVIALSPKTLMATNRFICEVCNKGFQREQNLQLHRRGHNLPWKLKQKTTKDQAAARKKVYLCPEPTCVHHDPARALGDLTGIKKHFSRKHGEKKFKCEKCSRRYAVQSDWKAHSKTCGTREYRCDCGTLFSRRDSFITHRAFCDALAQETARHPASFGTVGSHLYGGDRGRTGIGLGLSQGIDQIPDHLHQSHHTAADILNLSAATARPGHFDHLLTPTSSLGSSFRQPPLPLPSEAASFYIPEPNNQAYGTTPPQAAEMLLSSAAVRDLPSNSTSNAANNFFNLGFFSTPTSNSHNNNNNNLASSSLLLPGPFNNHHGNGGSNNGDGCGVNLFSGIVVPSQYGTFSQLQHSHSSSPQMSATALLQKAAQMGSTSSTLNPSACSLLRGFGLSSSSVGVGESKFVDKPPLQLAPTTGFGDMFGVGESDQDQNESSHLHHLMSSLAGGSSASLFGFAGDYNANGSNITASNNKASFATCDRLTRDFLGVGEIVRSMGTTASGPQREHQHGGIDIMSNSSMDSERNATAPTTQSFCSGNFQ
ncbi:hypothetical protein Nepgr_008566 [Nepenthes gracilis]|uniref:C2H2-type domain-containing protein n=1 Tax=Nepenthes gracilis TaxID=150966 RepID=A0AAD3S9Z7_NEPGR|nr:hypothetical protein Nepgr_008566 [Nepenthes gracilis]